MGSSAYAKLAWGVAFGDTNNPEAGDWEEADGDFFYEFETDRMPALFGFTESAPAAPGDWRQWSAEQRRHWHQTVREPYTKRFNTAVPLEFAYYGYQSSGTALVLKRTLHSVEWRAEGIDLADIAPPLAGELAAFRTVLEALGHPGAEPKLLLMASYG